MLLTPKFHHLHLNSTDPDRAIAFYTRQFPSTGRCSNIACQSNGKDGGMG